MTAPNENEHASVASVTGSATGDEGPLADRPVSTAQIVVSWGEGSAPSVPSVDNESVAGDDDSAIGGMSVVTSTQSLRSSIYEDVEENGRTYHRFKQGKYPLPNDEKEQERLDLQHALFGVTLEGKLHLAPIKHSLQNVLDIATGTGIWAIEFAQQFPSARVLGTDLSAIQPLYVPPNCRFEIDDAEDEWIFSDKFDYIHGRALLTCFKDPRSVLREAFKALEPGGYLELQDGTFPFQYIDGVPRDSHLYKWNEIVVTGAAKSGRPWTNAQHYKEWMEEIGFVDVVEKNFYWPTNAWPKGEYFKKVAAYWQADFLNGIEGISLKVMTAMGWELEEIQVFIAEVRKDVKDVNIKAYLPINVVYGRRPGLNEVG
ncbi:S-adenosyl-L-methionine-dependent methyltransferase [Amylocarpus encephaloides]|uniref:S-adenosyl-L-methionine-dependent methyltransferase n=1 Tax=Amylocarpus encephaloides TaxID=45428 RepID=A0A9P8C507_9HELO|nr:S-adenosyl-L-methionine-dependent methyltransferase [Amylocarpus encephaloides]